MPSRLRTMRGRPGGRTTLSASELGRLTGSVMRMTSMDSAFP
ncbi:hypothetical protein [Streptomyces sp. NBC_00859]|nr:hypothetical protein OG584_00905 [Streptomyces sp. NBC_00859]